MIEDKVYLGDGAYVSWDGYAFTLTAENGIKATDTIVLEPEYINELFKFYQKKMKGE